MKFAHFLLWLLAMPIAAALFVLWFILVSLPIIPWAIYSEWRPWDHPEWCMPWWLSDLVLRAVKGKP